MVWRHDKSLNAASELLPQGALGSRHTQRAPPRLDHLLTQVSVQHCSPGCAAPRWSPGACHASAPQRCPGARGAAGPRELWGALQGPCSTTWGHPVAGNGMQLPVQPAVERTLSVQHCWGALRYPVRGLWWFQTQQSWLLLALPTDMVCRVAAGPQGHCEAAQKLGTLRRRFQ